MDRYDYFFDDFDDEISHDDFSDDVTDFDNDENVLAHYGTKRHSGRYPWGSGEDPFQHSGDFLTYVEAQRAAGKSNSDIYEELGMSSVEFRACIGIATDERRCELYNKVKKLKEKGWSNTAIAKECGIKNESSVRSLLNIDSAERMKKTRATADFLKQQIDEKGMIDVGKGVNKELGISKEKMDQALYIIQAEGYPVYPGRVQQPTNPGQWTTMLIACKPGTEHKEIYNTANIQTINDYKAHEVRGDDNKTIFTNKFQYPTSIDSKRVSIRYAEDGGIDMDGVIELRRGVKDLDLGDSHYAQVRILVDGTHYLKGMAVYADDLPDGVDIRFNTNKTKDKTMQEVLKPIHTENPNNPFGSYIKDADHGGQYYYTDDDGKVKLGAINKRADEGEWGEWSKTLASQFLAKQNHDLINKQLNLSVENTLAQLDSIEKVTNPTVKRELLNTFADECDSNAVSLSAAAMPRQRYQVLLPLTTIKENEIYAPNYQNGEQVALVRFPHGGTFEIPILTVNNKVAEGISRITPNAKDAVGINPRVAEQLSGADFDGDTALVLPTQKTRTGYTITNKEPLEDLKGFDPKIAYPYREGMKIIGAQDQQKKMGVVSNLIMDMTLKGASDEELARAVKHSMVIIDAKKHKLNYQQSFIDNGIEELKKKYQGYTDEDGKTHGGASTLITRAGSPTRIPERQEGEIRVDPVTGKKKRYYTDPETGEKLYTETGRTFINKNGKEELAIKEAPALSLVGDANKLSSGTWVESKYAEYSNFLKAQANQARKEALSLKDIPYNKEAAQKYKAEADRLKAELKIAESNAPKERKATMIADARIKQLCSDYPEIKQDKKELKKQKNMAIQDARYEVGAKRHKIEISEKEFEAIQNGAISPTTLKGIIRYTDTAKLRDYASPKNDAAIPKWIQNKISKMAKGSYTIAEIASACGISASTVQKYM